MRQIRHFRTIADERQITRASKKLHMSQPPLSHSLQLLETEIGVTLFERSGRRMELTEAGRVLYERTQHFFEYMDETLAEVRETGSGIKGMLSAGCVKSSFALIPPKMKAFREEYPGVTFELREGDSFQLAEQLKQRTIDFAVVRLPLEMEDFNSIPLPDEKYTAIIPEAWAGVYGDTIAIEDLGILPLLLLRRISGEGQYEIIMDRFREEQVTPNVAAVCPDVDMILEMVSEEVGASIIPEATLHKNNLTGIKALDIADRTLVSESAIIWLKDRYLPKSAERFIGMLGGNTESKP
ncbi:LysR family transcriptional regulator [Salinicoccus carnicancri]|uniref:LysR family transcriptional regulator n=1 Tax=Salinicoccus carnicancri TaxID=558170 RepID=UPI001FE0A6C7|nr:LysR family transcriptional regulator [Salinicoccus carnicancri]